MLALKNNVLTNTEMKMFEVVRFFLINTINLRIFQLYLERHYYLRKCKGTDISFSLG